MRRIYLLVGLCFAALLPAAATAGAQSAVSYTDTAQGVVYEDRNGNERQDKNERGVRGVSVSNGRDVVRTDSGGRYTLGVTDETIIFITKPADYMVPVNEDQLPQFYYLHYPNGSAVQTFYPGVAPTGPLPESVDFALRAYDEPRAYEAIVFADPQTRSFDELEDFRTDVVNELVGTNAAFGVTAGDIVNDPLDLMEPHNEIVSTIGIPWWNLPGNHDMNYDVPDDRYATETYKRVYGPPDYSFDYGGAHFINLDNVDYFGELNGRYRGYLNERQLEWIRNDLAFVPKDKLVVIATHIPLRTEAIGGANVNTVNLDELLALLEGREHLFSFSGHDTSNSWQMYLEPGERRQPPSGTNPVVWNGKNAFHHSTLAEVRGSGWTTGPLDARGVQAADMSDGNPNGYYFLSVRGNQHRMRFKPASLPDTYRMRITLQGGEGNHTLANGERVWVPSGPTGAESISPQPTFNLSDWSNQQSAPKVAVNAFDGGERHKVQVRFDRRGFAQMEYNPPRFGLTDGQANGNLDPYLRVLRERYAGTREAPARPEPSGHIWTAAVPRDLGVGTHTITIRVRDPYGRVDTSTQSIRIVGS